MKLFKNYIILFDTEWFTLWNIPPLQPCPDSGASFEPTLSSQTPVWTFAYPLKINYERVFVPSCSWPQEDDRPVYFSFFAYDGADNTMAYYMMKPTNNQQDDGIPSMIPVLMSSTVTNGFEGGDLYGDMRVCDDWLIQPWGADERIAVNMTKTPTTRRGITPNKTFLLWASHRSSDILQCFDLCPTSGRLCCSVNDNDYEIRVMDYIVPL